MPSIGKDLVKIRKHLGLTLQDIQFATKLPQHTLEKIENDTIFIDAEEGPIYTRNFVRSYGRILKIDEDLLIEALDQREAGKYTRLLLKQYPELAESEGKKVGSDGENAESESAKDEKKKSENNSKKNLKKDTKQPTKTSAGDDVEKKDSVDTVDGTGSKTKGKKEDSVLNPDKKSSDNSETSKKAVSPIASGSGKSIDNSPKKSSPAEKSTKEIDWANVGQKISQDKKQFPVWVIGLIILIIILGVAGYFIVQSGLFSTNSPSQEEITTPPNESQSSSLTIELDEPQPQPQPELTEETPTAPPQVFPLDDTLTIVVFAALGNVDPVRVWSDTKPRFDPYWIEEGNAMFFDFEETVQIRGPFENMLLFLNGHQIENVVQNFYNEEEDYVEFNRSDFTSDQKWSEETDLQIPDGIEPPEEIRSRPTF